MPQLRECAPIADNLSFERARIVPERPQGGHGRPARGPGLRSRRVYGTWGAGSAAGIPGVARRSTASNFSFPPWGSQRIRNW